MTRSKCLQYSSLVLEKIRISLRYTIQNRLMQPQRVQLIQAQKVVGALVKLKGTTWYSKQLYLVRKVVFHLLPLWILIQWQAFLRSILEKMIELLRQSNNLLINRRGYWFLMVIVFRLQQSMQRHSLLLFLGTKRISALVGLWDLWIYPFAKASLMQLSRALSLARDILYICIYSSLVLGFRLIGQFVARQGANWLALQVLKKS